MFIINIMIATVKKILLIITLLTIYSSAVAELKIQIIEGNDEDAIKIAIIPFHWQSKLKPIKRYPFDLIIANDLRSSGVFNPLKSNLLVNKPKNFEEINYRRWKVKGVDYLLIGNVNQITRNSISIRVELVDILRKKSIIKKQWNNLAERKLRRFSHLVSDLIYEQTTGVKGVFSTKIAYITGNTRGIDNRTFILEIADADGHNPYPLLKSTEPILSPSWSPDGTKIAYVSFEQGKSEIIIQSLNGKTRYSLANYKGINGAPAWSPNGKYMAMALSKGGNSDIYIWDFRKSKLRQITKHYSIDTEPAWSPDGRTIYFTSDRRGSPQIFKVDTNNLKVERVTFKGKYNSGVSVAPDGKHLTFIHKNRGKFNVALYNLITDDLQILTKTSFDESVSFSPNGQMIIYSTIERKENILAVVSINGRGSQKLRATIDNVQEPDWGPIQR